MLTTTVIIVLAVLAVAGFGVSAWLTLRSKFDGTKVDNARERAETIVTKAEEEQRKLLLAAQEDVLKLRTEGENEVKEQRQELNRQERRFFQREEQLERKTENLDRLQDELSGKEAEVKQTLVEAEEIKGKQQEALESVAGLNVADARQIVVKRGEEEAQHDLSRRYYELEKEHNDNFWEASSTLIVLHEWSDWIATGNFSVIYEWGNDSDNEWETAFAGQLRYRNSEQIEPGIEFYQSQDTQGVGPVVTGLWRLGDGKKLNWEFGAILGTNNDTANVNWKFDLEYEFK